MTLKLRYFDLLMNEGGRPPKLFDLESLDGDLPSDCRTMKEIRKRRNTALDSETRSAYHFMLHRLARKHPDYGFTYLQEIDRKLVTAITHSANYSGNLGCLTRETYVAEFPSHSINATVRRYPDDGDLILVNTGLVAFLRSFLELMALTGDHLLKYTAALQSAGIAVTEFPRPPRSVPSECLADCFDDLFYGFATGAVTESTDVINKRLQPYGCAQSVRDMELEKIPSFLGQDVVFESLLESTVAFIIAHEYGHILSDHLLGADARMAVDDFSVPSSENASQQQEFEADVTATQILCAEIMRNQHRLESGDGSFDSIADLTEILPWSMFYVPSGCMFFFLLHRTFETISAEYEKLRPSRFRRKLIADHPPSAERMNFQRQIFEQMPSSQATKARVFRLALPMAIGGWFEDHMQPIATSVGKRLAENIA